MADWKASETSPSQWETYPLVFTTNTVTNVSTPDGTFVESYIIVDGKIRVLISDTSYFDLSIVTINTESIDVTKINGSPERSDSIREYLFLNATSAQKKLLTLQ